MHPTTHRRSIEAEPYWQGCREGRLLFQRCARCGEPVFHPRGACPYCFAPDLRWEQSKGAGTIYSFTQQHVEIGGNGRPDRPRVLGIAALEEGFHMFTEFLADDPAAVRVGAAVAVEFHAAGEAVLPKFRVIP